MTLRGLEWLRFEIGGYPTGVTRGLDAAEAAAVRSNRLALIDKQGAPSYYTLHCRPFRLKSMPRKQP
jgi:hypothetical protein